MDQLLDIDCQIIDGCDLVIFFAPYEMVFSAGMEIEMEYARKHGKRTYIYQQLTHRVIADIYDLLNLLKAELEE